MKIKTRKKIASILVAAALLCPMYVASVSASTVDIKWYAACSSNEYTFADLSRAKEDSSPVFLR